MKSTVTVHEAKTHLSRLLRQVEEGATIVIQRGGKPVARLSAVTGRTRRPGRLKGRIRIASDFDAPLPDSILRAFRGEGD